MDTTTQVIATARARRKRARRVQIAVMFAALVVTVSLIAVLPRNSALVGIVGIVMNAALVSASFVPFRTDEWHRRRALQALGVGFAVSVLWQATEALRMVIDAGHRVNPGRGLSAAGAAWLIADFLLRQREDDEAEKGA